MYEMRLISWYVSIGLIHVDRHPHVVEVTLLNHAKTISGRDIQSFLDQWWIKWTGIGYKVHSKPNN